MNSEENQITSEQASTNEQVQLFKILATRCRRCGGILTSDFGLKNGIGQCCQKKEKRHQPDENQISLFESGGYDFDAETKRN